MSDPTDLAFRELDASAMAAALHALRQANYEAAIAEHPEFARDCVPIEIRALSK